jgi:hypothetical protein
VHNGHDVFGNSVFISGLKSRNYKFVLFEGDVNWDNKLKSSNSCYVTALPSATSYFPEMRRCLVRPG